MKKIMNYGTVILVVIVALSVIMLLGCNKKAEIKNDLDSEKITNEILSKFSVYNGYVRQQTVDLWDTYFLKSKNIGNIHNNKPKIGWDTFHEGMKKFLSNPPNELIRFYNISVHPINSNLAWVDAEYSITLPDSSVQRAKFYDTLMKTEEGWKVVVSVVNPITSEE